MSCPNNIPVPESVQVDFIEYFKAKGPGPFAAWLTSSKPNEKVVVTCATCVEDSGDERATALMPYFETMSVSQRIKLANRVKTELNWA